MQKIFIPILLVQWAFLTSRIELVVIVAGVIAFLYYVSTTNKQKKFFNTTNNALHRHLSIISAVGKEYTDIILVDPEANESVMLKIKGEMRDYEETVQGKGRPYFENWIHYINTYVVEDDRENLKSVIAIEHLMRVLEEQDEFVYIYRVNWQNQVQNWQVKFLRIVDNGEKNWIVEAVRNVDDIMAEQEKLMQLEKAANRDQLTGFWNRRAYEEDLLKLPNQVDFENYVMISMDVNGLKSVNDSLGHVAGDEIIKAASHCMNWSMGAYGNLYRTGGDEFMAIIIADEENLSYIKKDFELSVAKWQGNYVKELSVSFGIVTRREFPHASVMELEKIADGRMYEMKQRYYYSKGIDRRGQLLAYENMKKTFVKILHANLTKNEFSIIQMEVDESENERKISETFSDWFYDLGQSEVIYEEDREFYLNHTKLSDLQSYFKAGNAVFFLHYRRLINGDYRRVLLEVVPDEEYTNENQTVYVYVKRIE